jgi:hypothetical protein
MKYRKSAGGGLPRARRVAGEKNINPEWNSEDARWICVELIVPLGIETEKSKVVMVLRPSS